MASARIQRYYMESHTTLAEIPPAPSDSLGGYPVRCAFLCSFLIVYINELYSPRKNVSSRSTICQGNFHSIVVETRPNLCKSHVRNKDEPLVDEAELLEINPSYDHIRLKDGRETAVSICDRSPRSVRDVALVCDLSHRNVCDAPLII